MSLTIRNEECKTTLKLYGIKDKCCKITINLEWAGIETSSKGGIKSRIWYKCKVCGRILYTKWHEKKEIKH